MSLIDGWLPVTLLAAAGTTAVVAIWPLRRTWRRACWPAGVSITVVAATAVLFGVFDPLQYRFPRSFYVWLGAAVFMVALVPVSWRHVSRARRGVSVLAALSCTAAAVNLVNVHYAYYPTFAALRGEISP